MFSLFRTSKIPTPINSMVPLGLSVQSLRFPFIRLDKFVKGIDNVHIDVHLSPRFTELSRHLIYDLLNERSSHKRVFTDKPSSQVSKKLEAFNKSYASMLTAAIHRAKEEQGLDSIRLFQIAIIKWILNGVQTQAEQLLYELRKTSYQGSSKNLELSERIIWINHHKNDLLFQVSSELFNEIQWVEKSAVGKLRESLLGVRWSIPTEILFNPLLRSFDIHNHHLLMNHYVLLAQDPDSCYGFDRLDTLIDKLLEEVANICHVQIELSLNEMEVPLALMIGNSPVDMHFSWKDVPANMEELFNIEQTQQALEEDSSNLYSLTAKLQWQTQANKILEQRCRPTHIIQHILAAYETPRLYEHYAKLIKPYLLYQTLCDEASIQEVALKLHNQLKVRPLRRSTDKPLSINELKNTKKRLQRLVATANLPILRRFITDFVTYRRDLKYYRLMQAALENLSLLSDPDDVQLSRSNGILYEFFEENEYITTQEEIRGHVIIKADLRGSTTMTDELCRRGLNPATHFSRNFFNPIRQLLETFGAEKVFIEGDAIILSLFEYQKSPDQWLATARACGLAKNMLEIVHKHNETNRTYQLPELELGIGICYCPEAPKFLYDGEQRIMISPAIGAADRLSSCSWKLRHQYANQPKLLKHVMVFQQPPNDAFKGEKGMTTFRYNLNGIELDSTAFKKLQNEIALRQFTIRLPGDSYSTRFYAGYYPDRKGETHEIVIREGKIKIWQENSPTYPVTNTLYYEVVTHKTILNTIKRAF